jgi:acetyltransferase-like isoleucine patch superfamily enzyme
VKEQQMSEELVVRVPHVEGPDLTVRLVEWLVGEAAHVEPEDELAILETSKTTWVVTAPGSGFLYHLAGPGEDLRRDAPVAVIAPTARRPVFSAEQAAAGEGGGPASGLVVTTPARRLLDRHQLSVEHFTSLGLDVLRAKDVEAFLARDGVQPGDPVQRSRRRRFGDELLDTEAPWDEVLESADYLALQKLLKQLRRRMKARFNRHVATGELLYDRWEMARNHGFGEGSSIYDACLLLGDVEVGKHCWVGPFTVLDAAHAPLRIGDYSSIGSGSQLYTHNTIQHVLTGGRQPAFVAPTTIGRCCFISPGCVIGAGTTLGDHCFVAAESYVEGHFDEFSYLAGNPARRVGTVELVRGRAVLKRFDSDGGRM